MTRPHTIQSVSFQQMADEGRHWSEAPLRCSCGVWTTSGGWSEHRGDTVDTARVRRAQQAWKARQEATA